MISKMLEMEMLKKLKTAYLHNEIDQQLKQYPSLYKLKPTSFPQNSKFNITHEKMAEYFATKHGFWVINLPLMLHNTLPHKNIFVRQLFTGLLKKIDWFCSEFIEKQNLPGARSIISPIFDELWDKAESRLYNAIAEICFAEFLFQKNNAKILSFEKKYDPSKGNKKADIYAEVDGKHIHFDIKNPRRHDDFIDKDDFRTYIEKKAQDEISREFEYLPSDSIGVIAFIYRPFEKASPWFSDANSEVLRPIQMQTNKIAKIYWLKEINDGNSYRDYKIFDCGPADIKVISSETT